MVKKIVNIFYTYIYKLMIDHNIQIVCLLHLMNKHFAPHSIEARRYWSSTQSLAKLS